jgi:hypothetical protein
LQKVAIAWLDDDTTPDLVAGGDRVTPDRVAR